MTVKAEDLLRKALELPDGERAELAGRLIESLDPETEEDIEAAWSEEIARRISAIDAGEAQFVTWDELKKRLSQRSNETSGS